MTTNKQDDQALADDQAFIQSLYDDLSDQAGDDATEQPSELLDQRILAAAHKAVATKPTRQIDATPSRQTNDNVEALKHPAVKRKKMAWYYPAAMAASLLLGVTIVNHQLSGPINPAYEGTLASVDHISRSKQSESLVASVTELDLSRSSDKSARSLGAQQTFKEEMIAGGADDAFAESEMPLIASVQAPLIADKKMMKSRSKAETASAVQKRTDTESVIAATKSKHAPSAKEQLLSKQGLNSPLSPTALSHKEYKALQAQSKQKTLYWLLQQENDSSYVIELFTTEQTSLFYRLNKNNFQLNKSSENKKEPFAEIIYITEK
ncbi:MAG: hypothetical protein ACJAT7_002469 [Psychromonas sp.]|jgi:hypothetical protein|uniref:hypothetical protein n=1 Tax=Psychromonas sp. TaxID=1884585 RepID=UPI0039E6E46A